MTAILPDYDGDAVPGRSIEKGATDWDESDNMRRQWWHVTAPPGGLSLDEVDLTFWALPQGTTLDQGTVWAYLVECDADGISNCFPITSLAVDEKPWSAAPGQSRHDIDFGTVGHVVPAGKVFRLVLENPPGPTLEQHKAERAKDNWMHFGLDTTPYPSVLTIG